MKQHLLWLMLSIAHSRGDLVTTNVSLGSEEAMTLTLKRNPSASLLVLQVSLKPLSSQAVMIQFWRKITKGENIQTNTWPG